VNKANLTASITQKCTVSKKPTINMT